MSVSDTVNECVGVGTFGKVLSGCDRRSGRLVAIKCVRAIEKYTSAAVIEANILLQISKAQTYYHYSNNNDNNDSTNDNNGSNNSSGGGRCVRGSELVVHMIEHFVHQGVYV